jgi:hypothetical protein
MESMPIGTVDRCTCNVYYFLNFRHKDRMRSSVENNWYFFAQKSAAVRLCGYKTVFPPQSLPGVAGRSHGLSPYVTFFSMPFLPVRD